MPFIKRKYWDKHIPVRDATCAYKDSERIGNKLYFGESLKNKLGKKAAIIVFQVIPVLALSILFAPVAIPVFAKLGVYRKTGRRIREVHYNRKFRFIDMAPLHQSKSKSVSKIEPSTILPREVLKLIWQEEIKDFNNQKALNYLETLGLVCKEWRSVAEEIRLELFNSSKFTFNDLPEICTKKDALAYIEAHKMELRTLNLLTFFDWEEEDISFILKRCPHLESLAVNAEKMSSAIYEDIIQFKGLKHLFIEKPNFSIDFASLKELPHLKTLHFTKTGIQDADMKTILASHPYLEGLKLEEEGITDFSLASILQFQNLKSLELLECKELSDFSSISNFSQLNTLCISKHEGSIILPSLINLPSLRNLSLIFSQSEEDLQSHLEHLIGLEALEIRIGYANKIIDHISFDTLTHLKELHLSGGRFRTISLDSLSQLKKLLLEDALKLTVLNFPPNLEEFSGKHAYLNHLPMLPKTLKKLDLDNCNNLSLPDIQHLEHLEQLRYTYNTFNRAMPSNYFDCLFKLKKLEIVEVQTLDTFPSLHTLTNLQVLRLNISLENEPRSLRALKNLKGLEMHVLPVLNAPEQLKVLKCANKSSAQWNELKNLEVLDISAIGYDSTNKNEFNDLENLKILSLSTFSVSNLPNLKHLKKLKELYLPKGLKNPKQLNSYPHVKKFIGQELDLDAYFDALID